MNALPSRTLCTVVFWMLAALAPCRAEFALRDGDRVFLGDSITTAQRYDRIIENYTLLRFPKLCVQFFNAGKGGDTAAGGLARPRAASRGWSATSLRARRRSRSWCSGRTTSAGE